MTRQTVSFSLYRRKRHYGDAMPAIHDKCRTTMKSSGFPIGSDGGNPGKLGLRYDPSETGRQDDSGLLRAPHSESGDKPAGTRPSVAAVVTADERDDV